MAALAGHLHPGTPTVGTRVELEHLRPTPVGGSLTVTADLVYVDGRLVRFDVTAYDAEGALVGQAQITHVRVERDRFFGRNRRRRHRTGSGRPPDSRSKEVSDLASSAGAVNSAQTVAVPSRIRSVWPATYASGSNGSCTAWYDGSSAGVSTGCAPRRTPQRRALQFLGPSGDVNHRLRHRPTLDASRPNPSSDRSPVTRADGARSAAHAHNMPRRPGSRSTPNHRSNL